MSYDTSNQLSLLQVWTSHWMQRGSDRGPRGSSRVTETVSPTYRPVLHSSTVIVMKFQATHIIVPNYSNVAGSVFESLSRQREPGQSGGSGSASHPRGNPPK
ncbi:hypothetical protein GBF38_011992 [Nibea albiflora]|uniref:Uncharacterized protein n=1 Tax=Nibea albiflora TaxID=240163 RepID=A0ACB7EHV6_NIBAL|nr:hypothetical protein GBF38_011992 [Nibea albiflora]